MDILPPPAERLAGSRPPTAEEIAAYVVGAAVWAPSVHNTQPWSFSTIGQEISPQLVLRLGTVIQTAVSVRRPPASVLFAGGGEHLGISHE